jgi:hypothetical protein
MPHRTIRRDRNDRVTAKLTAGSACDASEIILAAYGLVAVHRMAMKEGPEQEAVRILSMKLLRLAHWFGRLVESET